MCKLPLPLSFHKGGLAVLGGPAAPLRPSVLPSLGHCSASLLLLLCQMSFQCSNVEEDHPQDGGPPDDILSHLIVPFKNKTSSKDARKGRVPEPDGLLFTVFLLPP